MKNIKLSPDPRMSSPKQPRSPQPIKQIPEKTVPKTPVLNDVKSDLSLNYNFEQSRKKVNIMLNKHFNFDSPGSLSSRSLLSHPGFNETTKLDTVLSKYLHEAELVVQIFIKDDSQLAIKKIEDIFLRLKQNLSSFILCSPNKDFSLESDDLEKSRNILNSLKKNLADQVPKISDYELKLNGVKIELEKEKNYNQILSEKNSALEIENENLARKYFDLVDSVKSFKNNMTYEGEWNSDNVKEMKKKTNEMVIENESLRKNNELLLISHKNTLLKQKVIRNEYDELKNFLNEIEKKYKKKIESIKASVVEVYQMIDVGEYEKKIDENNVEEAIEDIGKKLRDPNFLREKIMRNEGKLSIEKNRHMNDFELVNKKNLRVFWKKKEFKNRAIELEKELTIRSELHKREIENLNKITNQLKENLQKSSQTLHQNEVIINQLNSEIAKMSEAQIKSDRNIENLKISLESSEKEINTFQKTLELKEAQLEESKNNLQIEICEKGKILDDLRLLSKKIQDVNLIIYQKDSLVQNKELQISELKDRLKSQTSQNQKIRESIETIKSEIINNYDQKIHEKDKLIKELQFSLKEKEKKINLIEITLEKINKQVENEIKHNKNNVLSKSEILYYSKLIENSNNILCSKLNSIRENQKEISGTSQILNKKNSDDITENQSKINNRELEKSTEIQTSFLKRLIEDKETLVNDLLILLDNFEIEHKTIKILLKDAQNDNQIQQKLLTERTKTINGLQSSLKMQEHIAKMAKEKSDLQIEAENKLQKQLEEKEQKIKDLMIFEDVEKKQLNDKIKNIKILLKKKYKMKIKSLKSLLVGKNIESQESNQIQKNLFKNPVKKLEKSKILEEKNSELENIEKYISEYKDLSEKYNMQEVIIQKQHAQILELEKIIEILQENLKNSEENHKKHSIEQEEKITNLQSTLEFTSLNLNLSESSSDENENQELLEELSRKEVQLKKADKKIKELQSSNCSQLETIKKYQNDIEFLFRISENLNNEDNLIDKN